MSVTIIPMEDVEYCLICGRYIGKGNDPALCGDEYCKMIFDYECEFNKWAREQGKQNRRQQ